MRHVSRMREDVPARRNLLRAESGRCAVDVDDCDLGAFARKPLRNRSADPTAAAGHDRNSIVECFHIVLFVCKIFEQFFELLNPANPGMIEGLIVRSMGHENDGLGFARDVMAILVAIIDEESNTELADENRFFVLSKIDDRIADAMRSEPIAGHSVDIITISHPTVGNKDRLVCAADAIEFAPLFGCEKRRQRAPELGIVRYRLHAIENHRGSNKRMR